MPINRVFKAFIPDDIKKDIIQYSYAKNLVGAGIISIFASLSYALLYYYLQLTFAAHVILATECVMLSSLVFLKYARSLMFANAIFIGSLTFVLSWLTYHLGGLYSTSIYWFILPPLIAAFIGGIRPAYFWFAISLSITTYIYFLEYSHFQFPSFINTNPLTLQYTSICGLTTVIISLVYFYEMGKKLGLEKLHYIAYHDDLTNLPNRIAYDDILNRALQHAKKNHSMFAVIYIDIDQFHKINNLFGRHVGDQLLKEIVFRIKRHIRYTDAMSRVGADEFKIVIETTNNIDVIHELANIIFMAIKLPYHIKQDELNITASMGVIIYPTKGMDEIFLDRYVDSALSKAKSMGGNCLLYFSENLAREQRLETEIETHLSDAIKNSELSLYFQPQFELNSPPKISGLEALLRWHNKKLGEVSPNMFIVIAERMGIIVQLGEWILKEACEQYVKWLNAKIINPHITLSINISAHQLYNEKFPAYVEKIIHSTGIPPNNLELELTETAIITDLPHAITILQNISKLGVHLVIDDFGAGYTSLCYLDKLPAKVLKIDKSFVDDILTNPNKSTIVESIIELAHKIHLTVIVEGVESHEQLTYFNKIHCDYVQGYYLSKPLDVTSIENLLIANAAGRQSKGS